MTPWWKAGPSSADNTAPAPTEMLADFAQAADWVLARALGRAGNGIGEGAKPAEPIGPEFAGIVAADKHPT